jgi:predicted RNase H-like HicB family nuclease
MSRARTISSSTHQAGLRHGQTSGPKHPAKDLPIGSVKSIERQAELKLRSQEGIMAIRYYSAIVERGRSGYGAFFPDFPGCVSASETIEEVARFAEEALALHIRGMLADGDALPEPPLPPEGLCPAPPRGKHRAFPRRRSFRHSVRGPVPPLLWAGGKLRTTPLRKFELWPGISCTVTGIKHPANLREGL